MTLYFLIKYLHVLGAIVILGTGTGIAFFMLMAHRSGDAAFIARTASTVVIADMLFTLTAVLLQPVTILTSLMDMSIGVLIAFRRTSALGLIAGILASLGYMVGAAIPTPDLWIEPLGALVKTGPAIVLMLVALLTLDNR